ncbi:MAG: EamA family transporter RarD [Bifidobacteriaceae bacterium]|jgi:chloramphenicol-sensitive protein RarD|nr:EamA family transporter RarD [Bifidobacteriaceae bacterium]
MVENRLGGRTERRNGLILGIGAYVLWGVMPLYLVLTKPAQAVEVIAHRVIWSAWFLAVIAALSGQLRTLGRALVRPRHLAAVSLAGGLLTVNWLTFVWAVFDGQIVVAALGYFINPLVSVLLGVVLLGERLRPAQWAAVGIGAVAVVVVASGTGPFPWVALVLALSFGFYGYIEKRIGGRLSAVVSLSAETLVLLPLALAYVVWLQLGGKGTFASLGFGHASAMVGLGAATLLPLLLFNGAARRLPLSVVGMLQYLAPVGQFATGVVVFGEPMPPARWIGFAIVWLALIILSVDAVHHTRRRQFNPLKRSAAPVLSDGSDSPLPDCAPRPPLSSRCGRGASPGKL